MKKRIQYVTILLSLMIVVFMSCSNTTTKPTEHSIVTDVYVVVWERHGSTGYKAMLLKNGEIQHTIISQHENGLSVTNNSLFVHGNDVYFGVGVSGPDAIVYKNGEPFISLSTNGFASSIFVYNGDVYVCGAYASEGKIWKNGEELHCLGTFRPRSIFIYNGDIYVAGTAYNESQHREIFLWKNGEINGFAESHDERDTVREVFVSNGDVYVVGTIFRNSTMRRRGRAVLWKNGEIQGLYNGMSASHAVYISNDNVYVIGWRFSLGGTLWVNGVPQRIGDSVALQGLFVDGNDVYIAGSEHLEWYERIAYLYKNGVPQTLHRGDGVMASSVFVVRR